MGGVGGGEGAGVRGVGIWGRANRPFHLLVSPWSVGLLVQSQSIPLVPKFGSQGILVQKPRRSPGKCPDLLDGSSGLGDARTGTSRPSSTAVVASPRWGPQSEAPGVQVLCGLRTPLVYVNWEQTT